MISTIAVFLDSIAILGSGAALYLNFGGVSPDAGNLYVATVCSIWVTTLVLFRISELYRFESIIRPLPNLDRMIIAFGTGFLFLLAAAFSFKVSAQLSRLYVGSFALTAFLATFSIRLVLAGIVSLLARRGVFSRNMIIVGQQTHVARLLDRLREINLGFVTVTALFVDKATTTDIDRHPILGGLEDISGFVRSSVVDDVVVALPWSEEQRILDLIAQLRELPVNVYLGSDLIGLRLDFSEAPGHFANAPLFSVVGHPLSGWSVAFKAVEDYVLAIAALVVAAIPMALVAILIKLDSPGPVFFKQQRYGFNNRTFWIYKFRTMRIETVRPEKTVQAVRGDARVTRLGRFLRRSSLDELPQIFNVLNGTMSFVGPRPHAIDHNEYYSREIRGYFGRHRVKPGITGWAQVNGLRGLTDTPEKMAERVRHDVYYVEHWSLLFDLRILLQTFVILLTGRNAH